MEKFLLLIREDIEALKLISPEEYQVRLRLMLNWVEELGERCLAAEPLLTFGSYVRKENVLSDGPFIEAKEAISGYFMILADNLDHAAELAQSCPQVINGRVVIEVRPIRATRN